MAALKNFGDRLGSRVFGGNMPRIKKRKPGRPIGALGRSRHAGIAAELGAEILSGARKPGSRMPSLEEMFDRFGVSRVVVREVFKTLTAKGMVAPKTRVGTIVRDSSFWNWLDAEVLEWRVNLGLDPAFLNEITAVRKAIEPIGAALAARNHTRKDVVRLRACIEDMRASEGDTHKFSEADLAFHVAVGALSGNTLFRSFNAAIRIALRGFIMLTAVGVAATEKNHASSIRRHEKVVDAISAGNETAAAKAMLHVIVKGQKFASYRPPVRRQSKTR